MRIRLVKQDQDTLRALEPRWRELESRSEPGIFRSWTWVGCVAERCDDPFLLEAVDGTGITQALALFNRRHGRLHLHETGDPALDAPFIEHNGLLVASGQDALLPSLFAALPSSLVLSGVDEATGAASVRGRAVVSRLARPAPFLDLRAPVLDGVSANTRAQLRRALRRYGEWGTLHVSRVADPVAGLAELIALHDPRWHGRGQPGAFAKPRTLAFHRALIGRGAPRGEVDLLRVAAGERTVGLLYNLRFGGRVFAYQGGFEYGTAAAQPSSSQLKPGLVCHTLAADWYREQGVGIYDLGAGEARYKRSLSSGETAMHWLHLSSPWSFRARLGPLRRMMRRAAGGRPG